tara:strand:+ start:2930 stop:4228 length:1299 start_codon:yes stop_codon:yes gene_type:complete
LDSIKIEKINKNIKENSVMIGFVGMTHLGLNMAIGTALKGYDVFCFDEDNDLVRDLKSGKINIDEPGLKDSLQKEKKKIVFTNLIEDLNKCYLIYVSPDIDTDNEGNSNLSYIKNLIKFMDTKIAKKIPFAILSQVPPGFTSSLNLERECYYQVETLIFGQALDRATNPERIIVGSKNKNISEKYRKFLNKFTRNIIIMNLESAELAKISINCFLMSSVTTSNSLAQICEEIGADWPDIVKALKLDKRIGKFAYLEPGLGISGGNLERDLSTIIKLSKRLGTFNDTFKSWKRNSIYRKDWVLNLLNKKVLTKFEKPKIAIWGITYKENTHSVKNSPSINLLEKIYKFELKIFDPLVNQVSINNNIFRCEKDPLACIQNADVLCIMNKWQIFKDIPMKILEKQMKNKIIIDPLSVITKNKQIKNIKIYTMGKK